MVEGETEGLRWRPFPTSRFINRRAKLSVLEPKKLQTLPAHFYLHRASAGQVPLGQQVPVME